MNDRWVELDRAATPAGDELVLRRCGDACEIRFNGWELMSTRTSVSEAALARLACAELGREPERILIGGLGLGYTVRAALDAARGARIVVCELMPAVAAWVRGPLAGLARRPLDDPRIELRVGDVAETLAAERGRFDIILLDTDNGPDAVMYAPNRDLYSRAGVGLVTRALAPRGVAGFWSADRSTGFEKTLSASAVRWRRVDIDVRGGDRSLEHSVYLIRHRS